MRQIQLIIGCYCYEVGMTLFLFIPNFFLRRYESNQCNSQFAFDGHVIEQFFEVQAYLWTLFNYVLPAFVMISSHAYVIHVLRRPTTGQEGIKPYGLRPLKPRQQTKTNRTVNLLTLKSTETVEIRKGNKQKFILQHVWKNLSGNTKKWQKGFQSAWHIILRGFVVTFDELTFLERLTTCWS
ncbi:hypothetical protein X801_03853, partial [Opisthorchis viverrini]